MTALIFVLKKSLQKVAGLINIFNIVQISTFDIPGKENV